MNAFSRNLLICLCVALLPLGCKKSAPEQKHPHEPAKEAKARIVATIHWAGFKNVAADTNAALLMKIMARPETAAVQQQFLDKLALSPFRAAMNLTNQAFVTNYSNLIQEHRQALILRSALEAALAQECRLDLAVASNAPAPLLRFSIKEPTGAAWPSNLVTAVRLLSGNDHASSNTPSHLTIAPNSPLAGVLGPQTRELTISQEGGWWILMAGDPSAMPSPLADPTSNVWLSGSLSLDLLLPLLTGRTNNTGLRDLTFSASGDGENVRTSARLRLATALPANLGPWYVPTNIIREPLSSFTAARQISSLSAKATNLTHLSLSSAPDQLFIWAREGVPLQTYFAAHGVAASNDLTRIGTEFLSDANRWMSNHESGRLKYNPNSAAIAWVDAPFMKPFVQSGSPFYPDFITGGLFYPGATNPPATELFAQLAEANVFYYDWELTGLRADQWIDLSQLFRIAFHKQQVRPAAPGLLWIKSVGPTLGNTVTTIQAIGTNQLLISRRGPLGLTGVELHLAIDWLESPEFPHGLHTLDAAAPKRYGVRARIGPPPPAN